MSAAFLAQKEFHGAGGLVITDEIALAIAAQAVLPVLHLGPALVRRFRRHRGASGRGAGAPQHLDESGVVHDWDEVLAGEAMEGGPVMLNWQDVAQAGDTADTGYNVVIHEFVHKIDLRDGAPDGCPPPGLARGAGTGWPCWSRSTGLPRTGDQGRALRRAAPWLDDYGATAIDEFFAVACEAYFVNRARFTQEFPELTVLFDGFYLAR